MTRADELPELTISQRLLRVARYFTRPYYAWVALAVSVIVGAALEPAIPALLKPLLDQGFNSNTLPLWMVPVALIGLFMLRSSASYLSDIAVAKITQTNLQQLRTKMFESISYSDIRLFRDQAATSLANTVVYEATNGAVVLLQSVTTVVKDSLTLVALTCFLLYLNWQLSIIVLLIFPVVAISMRAISKRVYTLTKAQQKTVDELAYVVEEGVLAHKEIRIQNAEKHQQARFEFLNVTLRRLAMKSAIAGSAVAPVTNFFGSIALSAVISIAILQSQSSQLSAGGFVGFVTAMLMLIAPIKHLSDISSAITRGLVAAERAIDLIENVAPERGGSFALARATGDIRYSDVSVRYPGASEPAVDKLSLHIRPGQFIAVVGLSGSGKTTLVNLLPRFVDLSAGSVSLDGVEVGQWELANLRSQFALVGQNVIMFNDTVLSNITLGLPVERERAMLALQAANLAQRVAELPQGMDTVVGHNASLLSGGERQRLAIARAIYKDAPILILDEATSALDTDTDSLVQASLRTAMQGRTTIAIAHRLSTIKDADCIYVMGQGRVLQQGSHDELMVMGGAYFEFIRLSQS
jgi:ATP-binding cassette, subfamily B, bacterial MsbA